MAGVRKRPMVKPELGTKRVCVSCSTRFYDLRKVPAICPKCATVQPADQPRPRRPVGNAPEEKRPKKVAAAEPGEDVDVDVEVADEEVEDDVLEDASDLEDGDDTISGEIEVETDSEPEET